MIHSLRELDVVAVGSWTNFDHLLEVTNLPAPGDTVQILSHIDEVERVHFGGCAPNVAVAAARLGMQSALVSIVGDDFVSRGYSAHLDELGVNRRGVQIIQGERCGHSFLFRDDRGNSVCISHIGVAASQENYLPDADILSTAAVVVITYRFDRFTLRAAELARNHGAQVIISGALSTAPELIAAFVTTADALVCTDHELEQALALLGCREIEELMDIGVSAIIRTRGQAGARWQTKIRSGSCPAYPADRVVDPTGAGDGFVAGLAAGLAQGQDLPEAIQLGSSVASFVVEAVGCQTGLPTMKEALLRLSNQ